MTELQKEWYREGKDRGESVASWVDVPDDLEGCAEYCDACKSEFARYACWMGNEAHEAESHGRQYSPFEFTASEINTLEEFDSDDAWQAFDDGIAAGIEDNITARLHKLDLEGDPFTAEERSRSLDDPPGFQDFPPEGYSRLGRSPS